MKAGIIGAGISGLSAALALAERGHEVAVFQKEPEAGGLIATFDFGGFQLEHFYHFLCAQDEGYFQLCRKLGLEDRVRFARARTGFYYNGREYPFSTPLDLLRFSPLPLRQRIRFGLFALEARMRNEWVQLDELRGKPWLIDRIGRQAYDVVWDPLLRLKFGEYHEDISAAWVWHRLHRVAKSKGRMGYLEGGTALLLDTLLARLDELGVAIHCGTPVQGIRTGAGGRVAALALGDGSTFACDHAISTVPLSVLADLLPEGSEDYAAELRRIAYIGVVCVSFRVKKAVSPYFWYNIHDPRVPLNGIIEYTNLNRLGGDAGHIVYVPYYVPTDHPTYRMDDEAIIEQSWQAIRVVNPDIGDGDRIASHVARSPYAQAICRTGFLGLLPDPHAPIGGLHLLDSTYLYPEDRTQSGHVLVAWERVKAMDP